MTNSEKKKRLAGFAKRHGIPLPKGFNPNNDRFGRPAQRLLAAVEDHYGRAIRGHEWFYLLPVRERIARLAGRYVGVAEDPKGSNWGKDVAVFLERAGIRNPAPWCAAFVTEAHASEFLPPVPAYVPSWENWAAGHDFVVPVGRAKRGDIVTFQFDRDHTGDHIGVIIKPYVVANTILTIEGNTDDAVRKCTRAFWQVNRIIRPHEYCPKCGTYVR
jgi:hypothetical protein